MKIDITAEIKKGPCAVGEYFGVTAGPITYEAKDRPGVKVTSWIARHLVVIDGKPVVFEEWLPDGTKDASAAKAYAAKAAAVLVRFWKLEGTRDARRARGEIVPITP